MVHHGPVWSSLVIAGPVCYRLVHAAPDWSSPGWSSLVMAGLVLSSLANLDQAGSCWSSLVQAGQCCSNLVQTVRGRYRLIKVVPLKPISGVFRDQQVNMSLNNAG